MWHDRLKLLFSHRKFHRAMKNVSECVLGGHNGLTKYFIHSKISLTNFHLSEEKNMSINFVRARAYEIGSHFTIVLAVFSLCEWVCVSLYLRDVNTKSSESEHKHHQRRDEKIFPLSKNFHEFTFAHKIFFFGFDEVADATFARQLKISFHLQNSTTRWTIVCFVCFDSVHFQSLSAG